MINASHVLDRVLVLEMVRVTEAAAIAASALVGRGDEKAADAAAVEAMRAALNELPMDGTVVIGEGERDEAPMLYIGEKVGSEQGTGPKIDIALDPLEGTTITAKAGPNSLAVLAIAEAGCLLNAPDVYMQKLAIGPGYAPGTVSLERSPTENVRRLAAAKGVEPHEIIACVLDRPRHEALVAEVDARFCPGWGEAAVAYLQREYPRVTVADVLKCVPTAADSVACVDACPEALRVAKRFFKIRWLCQRIRIGRIHVGSPLQADLDSVLLRDRCQSFCNRLSNRRHHELRAQCFRDFAGTIQIFVGGRRPK